MAIESLILESISPAAARASLTRDDDARRARRFAGVFVITFIAIWSAAVAVHFVGNPDGMFPSSRNPSRREMAWKTRQLHRLIAQGKLPTMLVLGSSRMMQASPQQLRQITRESAFNFATPGATPLVMLAQLRFTLSAGVKVKRVLIGLDDQAMFGRYDVTHGVRVFQSPELFARLPLIERVKVGLRVPAQIKPEMTWLALRCMIAPPEPPRRRVPLQNTVVMGDGYLVYPKREVGRNQGTYDLRADLLNKLRSRREMGEAGLLYPDGARVSERQFEYLRSLLRLCRKNRIEMTVVLTPSMPQGDAIMMRPGDFEARTRLSARLGKLCRSERATYRDLSNLGSFAGDPDEFWDENHITWTSMRRMVNVAYGRKPEEGVNLLSTDQERINRPTPINSANTP